MLKNRRYIFCIVFFLVLAASGCSWFGGEYSGRFLDVAFDGTWAFVLQPDTKTLIAMTPRVDGHTPPALRGLNEQGLDIGTQYTLQMPNTVQPYSVTAPSDLLDILAYSPMSGPIAVAPSKDYASVVFPVPSQIITTHRDSTCLYFLSQPVVNDDQCDVTTPSKQYATSVTLRFAVKDFNNVILIVKAGTGAGFTKKIDVPELGNEGLLRIAVQPAKPDDPLVPHGHAHAAFKALTNLFHISNVGVALPREPPILGLDGSGLDCLPPDILVNCTGNNMCLFTSSSAPPRK